MPSSLFGGFSDPPFITTDPDDKKTDPYIKSEVIPSRYTGSNFKVGRPKKGHGKDVYFSGQYLTFAASEQNKGKTDEYLNPGVLERRQAKERKAKNIDSKDFKFANPPKRSTGPGSYFGTFYEKPLPHMEEYKVPKRGEDSQKREVKAPKNILTSPPRKGTYGFIGTTFGKFDGPKQSDEYDALRKREQEEWKKSKEKMIASSVFRNTIKTRGLFDEKGATGVSSVYDHYDPPEEKSKKKKPKKPSEDKSTAKLEGRPVFKYSSGRKQGYEGCLNKFPNIRDDKPDPYESARIKAKEDKKKEPGFIGGTWKPVSGPKNGVVRSLLRKYY